MLLGQANFNGGPSSAWFLEDNTNYWADKKMLKFLMEFFIYQNGNEDEDDEVEDDDLKSILDRQDTMAIYMVKLMGSWEQIIKMTGKNDPPWHPDELKHNLVDEDIS
jgi:hypothetical protein